PDDDDGAPVLPLVSVFVPPETPAPVDEKGSEGSMPDTPFSESPGEDTGAQAASEASSDATVSPHSARPDAAPLDSPDTDVLLSNEADTVPPRELRAEAGLDSGSDFDIPRVLDGGPAGSYTVDRRLGRGGMGEVYLARQAGARGFSQLVAIKRLHPGGKQW